MGFLNWFQKSETTASEDTQLSLIDNSQPLRGRVDGGTVRREFTKTISDKGGSKDTHADATETMTRSLFGCGTDDLYQGTGGRKGDRTTLPQDAQTAYIVGETAATHELKATPIAGNKQQKHQQIVDTVENATNKTRGIFPWNW
jgi:hypothetical protein